MARGVFFSFDYSDVSEFKVNVVRNSRALKNAGSATKFVDQSLWEEAERKSVNALKDLIDEGLKGSSVTTVLIGSDTANRRWVKYELVKSFVEGKGIIALHINRIKSRSTGKISAKGNNPLDRLKLWIDNDCSKIHFYELVNRKWIPFEDLPFINNRQKNSFMFNDGGFWRKSSCGLEYKFSELFQDEYCWVNDDGYNKFPDWIDKAAIDVGR